MKKAFKVKERKNRKYKKKFRQIKKRNMQKKGSLPDFLSISAIVSSSLGKPPSSLSVNTRRPPVIPIRIGKRPKIIFIKKNYLKNSYKIPNGIESIPLNPF